MDSIVQKPLCSALNIDENIQAIFQNNNKFYAGKPEYGKPIEIPNCFERWSSNRIIEGNVQGVCFFSDIRAVPEKKLHV